MIKRLTTICCCLLCFLFLQQTHAEKSSNNYPSDADYKKVFPQAKINKVVLTVRQCDWDSLEATLKNKFGNQRGGGRPFPGGKPDSLAFDHANFSPPPFPGEPNNFPDSLRRPPMGAFPMQPSGDGKSFPPMPPGDGMNLNLGVAGEEESFYVPCTVEFDGKQWQNVGFRLKGNSSLMHCWNDSVKKYPFRLKFDAFEDSLPQVTDQRFYGFNELTFANGMNDQSFLREKVVTDIFQQANVPSPQSAFYQVFIDYGSGEFYFGLYTAVEVVDDTMLKHVFGNDSGNCYKPDGKGASFSRGSFDEASFPKKNNKKKKDWNDVQLLSNVLNDSVRLTDAAKWRAQLDEVLDVRVFLRWLAVNSVIQNWDTYGAMAHNYYLYNDSKTGKLNWIPWDNNEAFRSGRMQEGSLSHDGINDRWPLIRYLMDDSVYKAIYVDEMKRFLDSVFNVELINGKLSEYHELIKAAATVENKGFSFLRNPDEFDKSLEELHNHVINRRKAAEAYIESNQ